MISGAYKNEFADKNQFEVVAKKVETRVIQSRGVFLIKILLAAN